jgi:short subunit dehydrogenase-like uncharacterized protein
MNPQFDVIVFGATSFVGQILVQYLTDNFNQPNKETLNWAIAGRSQTKLDKVKTQVKQPDLTTMIADAQDEAAIKTMCAQARVIISTVGPYALFGETLVKVCAESGTDYCDLTGEVQWIDRMLKKYEATAKASGARIVALIQSHLTWAFILPNVKRRRAWVSTAIMFRCGLKPLKGVHQEAL